MEKKVNNLIKMMSAVIAIAVTACCSIPGSSSSADGGSKDDYRELRNELHELAATAVGHIGIAVISPEGDTLTINNDTGYQLMSVFKLHESLAVAHVLDDQNVGLDTIISISRADLNPDTWSPLYVEHTEPVIRIEMRELLRYILQQSDNNVSNLLFDRLVSVEDCDRFIKSTTGISGFELKYTERDMQRDHALANGNHSSPLACAMLIEKVFTDSLVSTEKQLEIQQILLDCKTGVDRIYVPLGGEDGVSLAHKTGSGYRDQNGRLMAHNDVGRIVLPDGRSYVLAVLVKDFGGNEAEASSVIASVSSIVYDFFK